MLYLSTDVNGVTINDYNIYLTKSESDHLIGLFSGSKTQEAMSYKQKKFNEYIETNESKSEETVIAKKDHTQHEKYKTSASSGNVSSENKSNSIKPKIKKRVKFELNTNETNDIFSSINNTRIEISDLTIRNSFINDKHWRVGSILAQLVFGKVEEFISQQSGKLVDIATEHEKFESLNSQQYQRYDVIRTQKDELWQISGMYLRPHNSVRLFKCKCNSSSNDDEQYSVTNTNKTRTRK